MVDRCRCGKALVPYKPRPGEESDLRLEGCWVCPIHGAGWKRPPDGLVPALVEAVEALLQGLNDAVNAAKATDSKRAFAYLDLVCIAQRKGEAALAAVAKVKGEDES